MRAKNLAIEFHAHISATRSQEKGVRMRRRYQDLCAHEHDTKQRKSSQSPPCTHCEIKRARKFEQSAPSRECLKPTLTFPRLHTVVQNVPRHDMSLAFPCPQVPAISNQGQGAATSQDSWGIEALEHSIRLKSLERPLLISDLVGAFVCMANAEQGPQS